MNAITADSLARAATLAGQIETLSAKLGVAQATVTQLTGELAPLQAELDGILGTPTRKACAKNPDGSSRFSPEWRAAISEGQKKRWAERKAAKAAAAAAVASTSATTDAPATA